MSRKFDLEAAHKASIYYREQVQSSEICGCFYCCDTFVPDEINQWTARDKVGIGQTRLCPKCGIDSVLGSASGYPITLDFLREMRQHWF